MAEDELVVGDVLNAFLDRFARLVDRGEQNAGSLAQYRHYLLDFFRFETQSYQIARLPVMQLEHKHVEEWLDAHPTWKGCRHTAMSALTQAFN